jgi:hypothetical protein
MASTVLNSLPWIFVVVGLALLAASFHLNRRAREHQRRMRKLLELSSLDIEPLELPAAAWPELAAGGWRSLAWEGSWFGQPVAGRLGEAPGATGSRSPPLVFQLGNGEDIRLTLTLIHAAARGETRLFAEPLARVFVLLLETRLRARSEALSAALAERARLSLYLQHDMRNLAQWVSWVSADFIAATPDKLLTVARRLKENAPLAWDRAERLTTALGKQPVTEAPVAIDLRPALAQAAQLAGIAPEIVGDAQAWVAKSLLARALDNLLSNLVVAWRENVAAAPTLRLASGEMAEIDFFFPWPAGTEPLPAEKLFEPFASGRPGGLGLGLYQARKSLIEAGGELLATPTPEGLNFRLRLPAKAP